MKTDPKPRETETTLRQIAEKAGVARSTVSRALQNHPRIGQETRDKIHRIAEEMGYRRDAYLSELMVRLRHRKESTERPVIAMIHWQTMRLNHPTMHDLVKGAWDRAREFGYQPEIFNISDFEGCRRSVLEVIRFRGIRGGILMPPQHPAPLPKLPWEELSVVAVGPAIFSRHLHRSTPNHRQCMDEAIDRLIELGYRRIGLVLTQGVEIRSEGQHQATYLFHRYRRPELFPSMPLVIRPDDEERFLRWYDEVKPDAILCGSTYGLISEWLGLRGICAPEQIGLANLQLFRRDQESGIWQNSLHISAGAVDLLKSLLEANETGLPAVARTLLFNGEWVDGSSTRPQS